MIVRFGFWNLDFVVELDRHIPHAHAFSPQGTRRAGGFNALRAMPPTPRRRGQGSRESTAAAATLAATLRLRSLFPTILSLWLESSWAEIGRRCPLLSGAWSRRSATAQGPIGGSAAASETKAAAKPMSRLRRSGAILQTSGLDALQERNTHRARTPRQSIRALGSLTTHERPRVATLTTGAFSLPDLLMLPGVTVVTSLS